jgi:hypothetical protein
MNKTIITYLYAPIPTPPFLFPRMSNHIEGRVHLPAPGPALCLSPSPAQLSLSRRINLSAEINLGTSTPMRHHRELHTPLSSTANPLSTLCKSSVSSSPEGLAVRIISRSYKTDSETIAGIRKENNILFGKLEMYPLPPGSRHYCTSALLYYLDG